jgi:transcriptional regulator with XRE-family HTH domain
MITAEQIKRSRGLLNLSQATLAAAAGYDTTTISDFEAERRALSPEASVAIKRALEGAGIEFTDDNEPGLKIGAPRIISAADPTAPAPGEGLGDAEAG